MVNLFIDGARRHSRWRRIAPLLRPAEVTPDPAVQVSDRDAMLTVLRETAELAGPPRFTAPGLVAHVQRVRRRRVRNTGVAAVSAVALAAAVAVPLALGGTVGPAPSAPSAAAPETAHGTLAGHLYGVGGPAPGLPRPWPGKVIVQGPGVHLTLIVGDRGTFSATVPAGRYRVVGYSPRYGSGKVACLPSSSTGATQVVTITVGRTTRANVLCQMS